jgi:nucleotide-binding universal stress UspA family protein
MNRILIPTDFSPTAEIALRYALNIALKSKSRVYLYHVYTPINKSTSISLDKTSKQLNTQTELNLGKKLQRLIKKVMPNGQDIKVEIAIGCSPIITSILNFSKKNNIHLIVMGTQGSSGLKKVIVGSVAASVIQKSTIPVLLIPEKFEWKDPQQIIYATDYQKTEKHALSSVINFAKYYNAEVTVMHLLNIKDKQQAQKEQINFDTYAYNLKREFDKSNLKFQLIETTSVTKTMKQLDEKFPYDILAMMRRKKSFLEQFFLKSFTQNMAYLTRKPLLIIPEEEEENNF